AGYARLIDRARHPVLTALLSRIMRQEGRHIAFYAAEAERRLAARRRARPPVLPDPLAATMRQGGRHIAFYAAEAERRLAGSRRAQRLCRAALRRLWRPVGAGVMPNRGVAVMV